MERGFSSHHCVVRIGNNISYAHLEFTKGKANVSINAFTVLA